MIKSPRKPLLILLTGPMRAGKSTVADKFISLATTERWHAVHNALGDLVREELAGITGVSPREQEKQRTRWRRVWQFWATEVRRDLCGKAYWLRRWEEQAQWFVEEQETDLLVVPDVRFLNEQAHLTAWAASYGWDCVTVRVSRGMRTWRPWTRAWWHRSEREWRGLPTNYHLRNRGSKEMLQQRVVWLWDKVKADLQYRGSWGRVGEE